jgi:hypothetical protein
MCRRGSLLLLIPLACIAAHAAPVRGDEVAAYLQRNGLDELLAVHLEQRLEQATDQEHDELLLRLADLYAKLLATVEDDARRVWIEQRSRKLLAEAPEGEANELRFALLRASYRVAERTAEAHRLRQADDESLARAKETLSEVIPDLQRLRRQIETRVDLLERRLSRAGGADAIVVGEDVTRTRELYTQCTFITAWALYYQSWLNDRPDNARAAQTLFTNVLDFGDLAPVPENVSVDLRSSEPIARCVLGIALCKSLTSSSSSALSWLKVLEHERAYEPLREQVPVWRLVIHLEHDEFRIASRLLNELLEKNDEVPLLWIRLAAVHALEARDASRAAADLARRAVTLLAARGELKQVFDLADRYGVDALGTSGFAVRYVQGALLYYEARDRHGDDEPTSNDDVRSLYREALEEFRTAEQQVDASEYPDALSDCARLIAWCLYFQGDLLEARRTFERASEMLTGDDAADALWMAVVCLDRIVTADPSNERLVGELNDLVDRFLADYPASRHAPKLVLRRAVTSREVSPELVADLLSIPPNSEVYRSARQRAAQMLYRLYRDAEGLERIRFGNEYLTVAVPLHADDERTLTPSSSVAFDRFLIRSRRILEVALHEGIGRLVAARNVLRTFDELFADHAADLELDELMPEVTYRRIQERLLSGHPVAAADLADELWQRDPSGTWARLGNRLLFTHARREWRELEQAGADDRIAVNQVVRFGTRVIEQYEEDPASIERVPVQLAYAAVAEAAMRIWRRSGDAARGREALEIYKRLLEQRPRNTKFLRATGLLAGEFDERELAIDCWRTLVAGLHSGSSEWFEAKFHLITQLALDDPAYAKRVMNQHKQLNPEYGPDPWGPRLRALDQRLAEIPTDDDSNQTGAAGAAQGASGR